MNMRTLSSALSVAAFLSCIHLAVAVEWLEPVATPVGVWAGNMGFSLKPTQAPDLRGVPRELRRRQDSVIPDNWCGFVNGDTIE
ncbi:hypothetical protein FGG08_003189 [Glutinoglossum americanum]|uniref:Uncharacterized protein n=1 Tax=Glutinoglossum americanum TaxID=1670608 RepID=A0A9P8L3U2_9PEZI|nr:hypothetical protein FGG08_003189 [Glutinoglossum americanum]